MEKTLEQQWETWKRITQNEIHYYKQRLMCDEVIHEMERIVEYAKTLEHEKNMTHRVETLVNHIKKIGKNYSIPLSYYIIDLIQYLPECGVCIAFV